MTNNLQQTLTDKLKAKMIEDRKASEQVVETQLRMFKQNTQKQFDDANASIDANMAELKRKSYLYQLKPWIILPVFSLLFIPCLVIGTYWTENYLDTTIRHKLETLEEAQPGAEGLGRREDRTSSTRGRLVSDNAEQQKAGGISSRSVSQPVDHQDRGLSNDRTGNQVTGRSQDYEFLRQGHRRETDDFDESN